MSDTDFFLNQTGGSVSTQLGTRLSNIKNQVITTQSVIGIQPDNSTDAIPYTAFGKSLLNVSTLNGLVGLLNQADSKVEVIDSGTGSIDFTLDNALKLSVKNAYTEVLNELRTLNVKPATDLGSDLGDPNKRYNVGYIRKITTNSVGQVSIGDNASTLGTSSVNIGNGSGGSGAPDYSVSIGRGANSEQSHTASICLGYAAGQKGTAQRSGIVAIGHSAGTGITGVQGMLNNAIAIGASASLNGGGVDSVAIGAGANGNSVANSYSVAIGSGAGNAGQGSNCIAIGQLAGSLNQNNNTIILNATGVALNSSGTDRFHIAPIRSGGTGNNLVYDTGTKEVQVGGVASMAGITTSGHITPDATNQRDLGSSSLRMRTLYTTDVSVNGNIYSATTATPIILAQDTTERARINASGQLEVKTATINNGAIKISTPSQSLNQTTFIGFSGDGSDGNDRARVGCRFGSTGGGNLFFTTGGSGTQADRMVITNTEVSVSNNILPDVLNTRDIGSSSLPFNGVYCNGLIQPSASNPLSFNVNGSNRMFINSSGSLICSTVASGGAGNNGGIILCNNSANSSTRAISGGVVSNEICGLSALGTNAGQLRLSAGGGTDASAKVYIDMFAFNNNVMLFGTQGAERMRISGANVGIGQNNPTEILDVVGNAKITGNILFDADNQRNVGSAGQALNSLYCHSAYLKSIQVHSATAGNIGTLANPFNTIYLLNADIGNLVSNIKSMNITPTATNTYTIGSSSSTQYNAIYGNTVYGNGVVLTSDINKKKDIQAIEDALSIIMRFESKSFKFKDGTSNRTHTGFIAQQIKEVVPDDWALYCDNKLGDIGLKYTEVIPLNTRAIQQLNERLTKVESRKLVGGSVIDTSGLTEDMVSIYQRLEALELEINKPVKPQLHRCVEISRINELFDRISNLECNESKSNSSEDFELMHSLMEKNHQQELRINELENKLNQIQSQPKVESKSVDFLAESDGGLNMMDMLQTKNYEMEQRILKLEKQNKKLVQAVNRLLKTNDE